MGGGLAVAQRIGHALVLVAFTQIALAQDRCGQLFPEASNQESAVCATLSDLYGTKISDEELRELVSKQIYGVSWQEAEKIRKQRASEQERAAKESAARLEASQCGRLFRDPFERDVCLWDSSTVFTDRSDHEVRRSVAKHIDQMKSDHTFRDHVINSAKKLRADAIQDRVYERQAEQRRLAAKKEAERRMQATKTRQAAAQGRLDESLAVGPVGFAVRDMNYGRYGNAMTLQFWLQNNTTKHTKDFRISCQTFAASGTRLSTPTSTLYQALSPGQRGAFVLGMGTVHAQSERASCEVVEWK